MMRKRYTHALSVMPQPFASTGHQVNIIKQHVLQSLCSLTNDKPPGLTGV